MPRPTDARARALETAEQLFRSQGYAATGLAQVIEESGSPKGSFYFHFPGGKRQLAREVLEAYRKRTSAGFRALADGAGDDSARFVRSLAGAIAREMSASNWTAGCVAQVLTQELAPSDAAVADQLAALFGEWALIIAPALGPHDDAVAAQARAVALIAALEGARTLTRASRSPAAFEAVAAYFTASRTEPDVPTPL